MLINFRQGIISYQDTPSFFLVLTGGNVNINADSLPVDVTFAHGPVDYLFTESQSIIGAWRGPFVNGTNYWLYWELDNFSGQRTFGVTTTDPFQTSNGYGPVLPTSPQADQHFFNTTTGKMNVWTGTRWVEKIRLFAAKITSGGILQPIAIGSQIGVTSQRNAGHILYNSDGLPIKTTDRFGMGYFITTETYLNSQVDRNNSYKLEALHPTGKAIEPIPQYYCVSWKGVNQLGVASYKDPSHPCIGISSIPMGVNQVSSFITDGYITNFANWNYTAPPGTILWVGLTGEIATNVPQDTSMQEIGYVVGPDKVFINIRRPILIDSLPIVSPTPSFTPQTPTPTPTITPTITSTVTPTVTPTGSPFVGSLERIVQSDNNGIAMFTHDGITATQEAFSSYTDLQEELNALGNLFFGTVGEFLNMSTDGKVIFVINNDHGMYYVLQRSGSMFAMLYTGGLPGYSTHNDIIVDKNLNMVYVIGGETIDAFDYSYVSGTWTFGHDYGSVPFPIEGSTYDSTGRAGYVLDNGNIVFVTSNEILVVSFAYTPGVTNSGTFTVLARLDFTETFSNESNAFLGYRIPSVLKVGNNYLVVVTDPRFTGNTATVYFVYDSVGQTISLLESAGTSLDDSKFLAASGDNDTLVFEQTDSNDVLVRTFNGTTLSAGTLLGATVNSQDSLFYSNKSGIDKFYVMNQNTPRNIFQDTGSGYTIVSAAVDPPVAPTLQLDNALIRCAVFMDSNYVVPTPTPTPTPTTTFGV